VASPRRQAARRHLKDRSIQDYAEGHVATFGARTVTAEEIIAFARDDDPQAAFGLSEECGGETHSRCG
jgi:hypothetical protein